MKPLTLLAAFIAALTCLPLPANAQSKYSKVKIILPEQADARNNLLGSLEIDHFHAEGNAIIAEISEEAVNQLKNLHIPFEVLVDDVARHFAKNNRKEDFYLFDKVPVEANRMAFETGCVTASTIIPTPAAFTAGSMGGYYTYAEMNTKMDALVAAYPNIVSKFSIGNSVQGRAIWCIKISDNVETDESDEAEVLYTGLQHAREAISGTSLIFFMQFLAENYAGDIRTKNLVDNRELFIIPCMNPDGYEYNRTTNPNGGGTWRKNRRLNSGGSFGVDLNRNYSVDWGNCAGASSSCGSGSQSSSTYWGTAPFSEPETNALKNFVTSRNFVTAIDQHCYGSYYSLPFGRPSLHTMSAYDQNIYSYLPALMGKYNCHRAGNSPQTVGYEVAGGLKDWLLLGDIGTGTKEKIYSMTGEANGTSFWAPTSSIIPFSKGLCFQNLQIAFAAGSYVDLQDVNDVAITETAGTFNALLRRVGLSNAPVTISLEPVENIETTSSPVTINNLNNFYDTTTVMMNYTLPPYITNGERVVFVWKIETGGYSVYDTVTKYYNPLTLLADNMDGTYSINWTGTNGWAFTTGAQFQGTKSMTESPSGNYTNSSTRRSTYRFALNLAGGTTGAYLSFWVKHRAENCNDKLQIQISTNGFTYVPVCGRNTITESSGALAGRPALTGIRENWTRELVDLSAYKGFSNVRLRFEFTSNANVSGDAFYKKLDDGFYIDNLKVIKTLAPPPAGLTAVNNVFVNLQGEILPDNSGLLSWEAFTDNNHEHFVVEKSINGKDFSAIATVKSDPPYQITDQAVGEGNNYYRITQVNRNGATVKSKSINLFKNATSAYLVLYPNPVADELQLRMNSILQQTVKIEIADIQGRVVYNRVMRTQSGPGTVLVNTKSLRPQVYFLYIRDSKNKIITIQKFIKE